MSQFDYEGVLSKLPQHIEALTELHLKKMPATVETIKAAAKITNNPQFLKDAEEWDKLVQINERYMRKFIGAEGDVATETASMESFITMAKKMKLALGGV